MTGKVRCAYLFSGNADIV